MDDDANLPGHTASIVELWDEIAAIFSGLIGGGRYGLKIRVPHALGEFCFIRQVENSRPQREIQNSNGMIQSNRRKICVLSFKVMTFLFGGERSFLQKAKVVAKLAAEHASNLAAFAGLYKVGKTHRPFWF
jgi:hypothetical protein